MSTKTIPLWIYSGIFLWLLFYFHFLEPVNSTFLGLTISNILKVIIWIFPVFIYVKQKEKIPFIRYLKLTTNIKVAITLGCFLGTLVLVLFYISFLLKKGNFINWPFETEYWFTLIIIPVFTEEIFFRGFLLQQFEKYLSAKAANIITAFLFAFIHIPVALYDETSTIISFLAYLFIFGATLGTMFQATGSLWPSLIVHACNNLAAIIFVSSS